MRRSKVRRGGGAAARAIAVHAAAAAALLAGPAALAAQSLPPGVPGASAPPRLPPTSSASADPGRASCSGRFLPTHAFERAAVRTMRIRRGSTDLGFPTRGRVSPDSRCGQRAGASGVGRFLETRLLAGEDRGRVALTTGSPPGSGSRLLDDRGGSSVGLRGEAPLGTFLPAFAPDGSLPVRIHVGGDGRWSSDAEGGLRVDALWAEAVAGAVHAWAGRRSPAFGPGRGGGITLSGGVPLDGVGIGLERPVRLPGFLRHAGAVDFETLLARGTRNGEIERPWILAGRWTLAPAEGLVIGLNRTVMFGGEGAAPVTPRYMLQILVGAHPRDEEGELVPFSNQVASLDVTWHLRPGGVPLVAFVEWGMEDNSGAWMRSPAVIAGLEAAHPVHPVRIGVERTYMSGRNGHGLWYRHSVYRAGWSDAGRLLGHPLAGPGTEWLVHGAVSDPRGGWEVEAGARTRLRIEGNSFSPMFEGRSWGGFVNARVRTGPVDLYVQLDGEHVTGGAERLVAEGGVRWVVR